MSAPDAAASAAGLREARGLYPATARTAYFNTAAVGLASSELIAAYRAYVDAWEEGPLDYVRGESAAERARAGAAHLIGADAADVALIASVSAAAGLVASQFGPAERGQNVVIGEREYSSNHFPWRLLARKGYDVRQVPFHNGGIEPDAVAPHVDGGTALVAFSGVQTASGHRTDIAGISVLARAVGAVVFVDGSQLVGALPVAPHIGDIDVLATSDHKFLMHAGRGMGYCYLSRVVQERFVPVNAGWKAGRVPFESYFGPEMDLSLTASRFDSSISWVAAVGNAAALAAFDVFGADAIHARNAELSERLRVSLIEIGCAPLDLPEANRSTIVSVPLRGAEPGPLLARLKRQGIVCSARDGNLRTSVHFYNHEDDIDRLTHALSES